MLITFLCIYASDTAKGWHDQLGWLINHDHQTQQEARQFYRDKKGKAGIKKNNIDDNVALTQGYALLQKEIQRNKKKREKYEDRYQALNKPKKTSASIMNQDHGHASAYAKKNKLLEKMKKLEQEKQTLGSGHANQLRKHQIGKEMGVIRKKLEMQK